LTHFYRRNPLVDRAELWPRRGRLLRARAAAQNVIEYGILIATIALIVLLGVFRFGDIIAPWFTALAARITTTGT
jgi:Flp pilus assembly pilin Flp